MFPNKPLFSFSPKIFGSTCFIRDVRPQITKLDPKSLKCIFVGYSRLRKGYRCFCPSLNKYIVSIDVNFFENTPFFSKYDSTTTSTIQDSDDFLIYFTQTVPTDPFIQNFETSSDQNTDISNISSPVDPITEQNIITSSDLDLPIALRKENANVLSLSHRLSHIITYPFLHICSSLLLTQFQFLNLLLKPYLFLVGRKQ